MVAIPYRFDPDQRHQRSAPCGRFFYVPAEGSNTPREQSDALPCKHKFSYGFNRIRQTSGTKENAPLVGAFFCVPAKGSNTPREQSDALSCKHKFSYGFNRIRQISGTKENAPLVGAFFCTLIGICGACKIVYSKF